VCAEKQAYLDEVRDYMPPKHAIFIPALRNGPSILQFGELTSIEYMYSLYGDVAYVLFGV